MGSFPEMFNSFCGLWRWGLVMCAGSLYSYIQDYNRRESFSLKKKKNKQTNKQTNKRQQQQKYIYIYIFWTLYSSFPTKDDKSFLFSNW